MSVSACLSMESMAAGPGSEAGGMWVESDGEGEGGGEGEGEGAVSRKRIELRSAITAAEALAPSLDCIRVHGDESNADLESMCDTHDSSQL